MNSTPSRAMRALSRARSILLLDHPFYGALAVRLRLEDAPADFPHLIATDGQRIVARPEVADLPMRQIVGIVAHEVLHCAHAHHTRRAGRDLDQWNVATDLAINDILTRAGFELPEDRVQDPGLGINGEAAETIWARLYGRPQQQLQRQPQHGSGKAPQQDDDAEADGQDADADGQPGDGRGAGRPGQLGPEAPEWGRVMDAAPEDREASAAEWRDATIAAATAARGDVPGDIARQILDWTDPVPDWIEQLEAWAARLARNDYSFARPSRRSTAPVILPGLSGVQMDRIAVAIDTSGSIPDSDLGRFMARVREIVDRYHAPVSLIYCDARVAAAHDVIDTADLDAIRPAGGGGTDFRPAFDWIADSPEEHVGLVYLTDLYGTFPPAEEAPEYPVLWVSTTPRRNAPHVPFGEVAYEAGA